MATYPAGTIGGRSFVCRGVGNGATAGTISQVQTFNVAAENIKRAIRDGVQYLRLNFPVQNPDMTEVFSCVRSPARSAPPDVIIDASSEQPVTITLSVDPSAAGYVVQPGGSGQIVFNEGERVTYSLIEANPTITANTCCWLEMVKINLRIVLSFLASFRSLA